MNFNRKEELQNWLEETQKAKAQLITEIDKIEHTQAKLLMKKDVFLRARDDLKADYVTAIERGINDLHAEKSGKKDNLQFQSTVLHYIEMELER